MAFWGIEVKPGKPFTQEFNESKGRLHVSLATLGFGTAVKKCILQCNVGNKSPVYLCSLFPEKTECLQLNLEFEEADDIVFSVIGPRSIHLSGYFLGSYRRSFLDDNSESYGEDIANSETQGSQNSDEDMYEDSFINDDEPEVCPPSPISSNGDELSDKRKPKSGTRSRRQLKKKFQLSDSDEEEASKQRQISGRGTPFLVAENEDKFLGSPISSMGKSITTTKNSTSEHEVEDNNCTFETNEGKTETNGTCSPRQLKEKLQLSDSDDEKTLARIIISGHGILSPIRGNEDEVSSPKTEVKDNRGTREMSERKTESNGNFVAEVQENADDLMVNGQPISQSDLPVDSLLLSSEANPRSGAERKKKQKERSEGKALEMDGDVKSQTNEVAVDTLTSSSSPRQDLNNELPNNFPLPSTEGPENNERPKKRKKELSKKGRNSQLDSTSDTNAINGDKAQTTEDNDQIINSGADGDQSVGKKATKKKKKNTTMKYGNSSSDVALGDNDKTGDSKSSRVRTLPSGLIIEEFESGKPDGRIAESGKKLSVRFVGKLKENEEIFDSNENNSLYKFRLGSGKVIDGWESGLDGMRVGEKRRLTIPPEMGYGSKGYGEKIPPNSWLLYDVELVKVR